MAVTVSTVLGPEMDGWMSSNRRKTVARIKPDQTRPDHLKLPVEITPGIRGEVSPRVCRGVFPMFQSRSSDRSWRPDKQQRRWGGGEGSDRREADRIKQSRREGKVGEGKNRTLLAG